MVKRIVLAVAALLLLASGIAFYQYHSAHAERLVVGKVLVVLKNAEVRKLGLVDIQVLPASEADRWVAQVLPMVSKALKESEDSYSEAASGLRAEDERLTGFVTTSIGLRATAEAALRVRKLQSGGSLVRNDTTAEAAKRSIQDVTAGYSKYAYFFTDDIKKMVKDERFKEIADSTVKALDRLGSDALTARLDGERKCGSISRDATRASKRIEEVRASLYLPPSGLKRAGQAISDGDGQFSLRLPPGDYVVFANSSRQLSEKKEESYYWAVRLVVRPDSDNAIILGNQNLESASIEGLWSVGLTSQFDRVIASLKSVESESYETSRRLKSKAQSIAADQDAIRVGLKPYK